MKILVPFNDEKYLPAFLESGASEFYMGFYDPAWAETFGSYSDINRLSLFQNTANRYTIEDVARITDRLHEKGATLYITLNAPGYTDAQIRWIAGYLEKLGRYGVDGAITSVPELIPLIRENGLKATASTMCGIVNCAMAGWYQSQGMQRVIFPRELNTAEIADIMQSFPDMEYEVFFMRNGCHYADSSCLGMHGGTEGALCWSLRHGNARILDRSGQVSEVMNPAQDGRYMHDDWDGSGTGPDGFTEKLADTHRKFCSAFHSFACGQCSVYRFLQLGVSALKIVGRLDDMEDVLSDIRITSENIKIAEQCGSEEEYLARMIMPGDPEHYCMGGWSCYYPEVRWG